ncbi:MAG TPA: asparagine synthase (glutamine-hydrolyzing) [Candidatus Marinimicrobia bacterium]|nr:asparagine synthase (glutamine-hydrolyzing) [Candidatus Neomarinimicrobiota bacterium]
MCGICGIVDPNENNHRLITEMTDLLKHRGPEKAGYFHDGNVSLGHRRLAIIDLATGDQPIYNEDRTVAVVMNGEIYNFQEFKADLIQRGHHFYTNSDAEILTHGYEEYGLDFLSNLNGVFAFALYDIKNERLVLVRDHFGVKPLHYWFQDEVLLFSSEYKAILVHPAVRRQVNFSALHCQVNLRYNQSAETLIKGIFRLPPASYLIYENGQVSIEKYYQLPVNLNFKMTEAEAIDGIRFHLQRAVKRQLISDVPLGVYLSGGMDSSSLVAMMAAEKISPINTFTLGFNEATDEFDDAAVIARQFNTNHTTTALTLEPLQHFPETIWHTEEPKINLLQGFHLSEFVSRSLKVVLGGLGGDELFIGYDIYRYLWAMRGLLQNRPGFWQKTLGNSISSLLFSWQNSTKILKWDEYRRGLQMLFSAGDLEKCYLILRNCWDYDMRFAKEIYQPEFLQTTLAPTRTWFDPIFAACRDLPPLDAIAYVEFHSKMLNDYILTEDRMSMAHSLELRVPFLDKDLVEFAFTIPATLKMKNGQTKYLFRKAMAPYLPPEILQKKKRGFAVNPYDQFNKDLKKVAEKVLTREFIQHQGIFNYEYIKRILNYPPDPRLRWHYNFLWIVLGLAIWERMFIETKNYRKHIVAPNEYYQ